VKHLLYDWGGLNLWLFQAINGHQWHAIDSLMALAGYAADFWSFPFYAGVWVLALIVLKRRGARTVAVQLQLQRFVIGFVVAVVTAFLVKYGLDVSRPVTALGAAAVHVLGHFDSNHSLPSGHATFAMLLAASLWPILAAPGRAAAVLFVAWAGVARIWTGAHFPADVVAGYLIGIGAAGFSAWLVQTPVKLRRIEFRRPPRSARP
jgi:signal peptidase II